MGIELVEGRDLIRQRGPVMMRTTSGIEQVHVFYRRVDDEPSTRCTSAPTRTNDIEPGDRHIVDARGRDYSDVPPLTGIFSGGKTSTMAVDVQVTRLA